MSEGKELGEALAAVEQAVSDVLPSLKDGFQPKDLAEIGAKVVEHLDVYLAGIKGVSEVPAEVKDLSKSAALRIVASSLNQLADQLEA
jgi:hypothetical protein